MAHSLNHWCITVTTMRSVRIVEQYNISNRQMREMFPVANLSHATIKGIFGSM